MSTSIRISEEIYDKLKEISEKSGKSIKEIVEEAINVYLLGKSSSADKEIKSIKEKWIVLKYPTKCSVCKKDLKEGELVYWVRVEYSDSSAKTTIICSSCYYEKIDTSLAKQYLKRKELEATVKGLKKEADRLASEVQKLQQQYDILTVKKELVELWRAFRDAFLNDREFQAKFDSFMDRLNELTDRVSRLETQINIEIPRKKVVRVEADRVYSP